jgi:hypothetical protein
VGLASLRAVICKPRRDGEASVVSSDAAECPAADHRFGRAVQALTELPGFAGGDLIGLRESDLVVRQCAAVTPTAFAVAQEVIVGVVTPAIAPLFPTGVAALQCPGPARRSL